MSSPKWLEWVRRLQAVAQNGLMFCKDPFDRERYEHVQSVAEEILSSTGDEIDAALVNQFMRGERGYATPKVDVRGAVFRENRLLFVREKSDGLWTLPGGWADVGESPAEAVVREVEEESGFVTRAAKLIALYDRNKHAHPPTLYHSYKAFFLCDLIGGAAAPSVETTAVEFFALDALPPLSTPRITPQQIERLFAHHADRALPTEFD